MTAKILIFGTGSFAGRIIADIAAVARDPVTVVIAGRNQDRLDWLRTAGGAHAVIFSGAAKFIAEPVDLQSAGAAADIIGRHRPAVVVQAASVQTSAVISATGSAWSRLVAEGGLSATAVSQAMLSLRVAEAIRDTGGQSRFINACFPDVVNGILQARGHRIDCGVGNVAILSNAFAAETGLHEPGGLRMIAHYQNLGMFRRTAAARTGPYPRVWIGEQEVSDVGETFRNVKLTTEPAIEISGGSGVMLMLAMGAGRAWRGHVPGPNGLPGGYPVFFRDGAIELDLPDDIGAEAAIAWNRRHEEAGGMVVETDGQVQFRGRLRDLIAAHDPELAKGFAVADLEAVNDDFKKLRTKLES